jgi:hypothetical protein
VFGAPVNGRTFGQRAGWLVIAAVLLVGGSVGFNARPGPAGAPAHPVAVVDAATDGGVPEELSPGSSGAGWRSASAFSSAFVADALDWPSVEAAAPVPAAPTPAPKPAPPAWWSRYTGTNHVWMPTLGINRAVYSFPCSRSTSPDNLVYRWGCAGRNNVYLLGHAYGVFKALHDAYYNGRLKIGMPVIYADSHGHVQLYRVVTWRVVRPANATWAIAPQRVPSMTLQTCIGSNDSLRLNVRLVAANS